MRIDKINTISSYKPISNDATDKKTTGEKRVYSTDRVEVGSRPSADQMKQAITDKILKSDSQRVSPEKLESIKQRISENRYYVSTDDLVNSMLK